MIMLHVPLGASHLQLAEFGRRRSSRKAPPSWPERLAIERLAMPSFKYRQHYTETCIQSDSKQATIDRGQIPPLPSQPNSQGV